MGPEHAFPVQLVDGGNAAEDIPNLAIVLRKPAQNLPYSRFR